MYIRSIILWITKFLNIRYEILDKRHYESVYDKESNVRVICLYVDVELQWGTMGGPEWQAQASPEELEMQKEDGRNHWRTMTEEELQDIKSAGDSWWQNAPMNQRCYSLFITECPKWRSTLFAQLEGAATGYKKISLKPIITCSSLFHFKSNKCPFFIYFLTMINIFQV